MPDTAVPDRAVPDRAGPDDDAGDSDFRDKDGREIPAAVSPAAGTGAVISESSNLLWVKIPPTAGRTIRPGAPRLRNTFTK
ncbi:hypothetical protein NicSoilB8_27630 [Arthrobacter sp. NicSoilB8]|nr:hypothetical protein NicSoilB8_27630 [Arthrobacter sp. NicSoilB8]